MNESTCAGILVIDDDDDIRNTIIQSFGDEGYRVFGARHGKEALEKLRNGAPLPCVILLDIMMPIMDGRAFRAEQLLDPRLCEIPIVVVTANANLHEMENELKTSGALRKPVSLKQLFKVAELHCGKPEVERSAC
jgi:CheY-like chemotaxis protein